MCKLGEYIVLPSGILRVVDRQSNSRDDKQKRQSKCAVRVTSIHHRYIYFFMKDILQLVVDRLDCVTGPKGEMKALNLHKNLSSGLEGAQVGTNLGSRHYWTLSP